MPILKSYVNRLLRHRLALKAVLPQDRFPNRRREGGGGEEGVVWWWGKVRTKRGGRGRGGDEYLEADG